MVFIILIHTPSSVLSAVLGGNKGGSSLASSSPGHAPSNSGPGITHWLQVY